MKKKGKKNKKNNKVGKENVVVAVADSDDESADDERSVVWHATMTRDCGWDGMKKEGRVGGDLQSPGDLPKYSE